MEDVSANQFDAGAYWQTRVGADADLAVVGHRSMGPAYNAEIYARRIEALEAMLSRSLKAPIGGQRVLDVGCGSGFYTDFWREYGVSDYTGVDISAATIERLAARHPDYGFQTLDITECAPSFDAGLYDLVTVFDVFYHIVDGSRFESAVGNVSRTIRDGGLLIVMDQLNEGDYQLSPHVVFRDRETYLETFRKEGLEPVDAELLFHYLVPPMIGIRALDLLAAAVFKMTGLFIRSSDGMSRGLARYMRRRDTAMRERGKRVANSELLAFRKVAQRPAA